MPNYDRPTDILNTQDNFQNNEVGITHPDQPSFVKLNDQGDIEIFASEGVGIMIHKASKSIVLVGDQVRFMTKEKEGLRWNRVAFNENAIFYQEPTLIPMDDAELYNIYAGVNPYLFGGGTVVSGN